MVQRRQHAQLRRVRHQHVEPAEALEHRGAHAVDGVEVAQIARHQDASRTGGADLVVQFLERALGARSDDQLGALVRESPRHGPADPPGRAGDERHPSREPPFGRSWLRAAEGRHQVRSSSKDSCKGTGPPSRSVNAMG